MIKYLLLEVLDAFEVYTHTHTDTYTCTYIWNWGALSLMGVLNVHHLLPS